MSSQFNPQEIPAVPAPQKWLQTSQMNPQQGFRGCKLTLSLTSLWEMAWAQGGRQPWRKGLSWKGMRRSSGPRSPSFCAVAPFPSLPESCSLWGRTLPGHGGTVRILRAPLHPGARHPLPHGGHGWERWTVGSDSSSWWMPRLEVSAAHSSSLSGKTHNIETHR